MEGPNKYNSKKSLRSIIYTMALVKKQTIREISISVGQTVGYFLRYVFTMGLESYVLVTLAASFLQVRWLVYMVTTDQVALLMTSVSVSGASAAWDEHDLKLRNVGKTLSHCQALVQV